MKFLDTFSGIGGFRLGMEAAGHECIGYVEIDKFARKSYEAIHDTKGEWTAHDITGVSDESIRGIGRVDVICGGFPCQAFSVAGKRGGFSDTRGTLFFEIARFASILRPRYLFLENVTGLLSHDNGNTFETILGALDEIGYDAEWDVLNSKDYGVPQNRERVFIIGHLRGSGGRKIFPITGGSQEVNDSYVTTGTLTTRYPASQREGTYIEEVRNPGGKIKIAGELDIKGQDCIKRVYDVGGLSPSLTTMQGGNREPKIVQAVLTPEREEIRQMGRRFKDPGEPMFTLTSQDRHGVAILRPTRTEYGKEIRKSYESGKIEESRHNMTKLEPRTDGISNTITTVQKDNLLMDQYRIRKLTPRECFRLQGFPDWAFDRAAQVNSDSQLYKQAGNSVSVPVIYEIAKRL